MSKMKIILISALCYLNLVQNSDSRKYRAIVYDEILPYLDDKSVPPYSNIVSTDNLVLEQIDDDSVLVSGYLEWLKSMDRSLPIRDVIRTKYLEQASWKEGPFKLAVLDLCPEYLNPTRFWYNITKLWTAEVCPPLKGDKWMIEEQIVNMIFDLPPSTPIVQWRSYSLLTQGIPGFEKLKLGFGMQTEFEIIK